MKNVKERLLKTCIKQQLEIIDQLHNEIVEAQKQANDYGQPKDRYDAYRTKLMRQIELYAKQLDKAKMVYNTLQKIDLTKETTSVEFGSVVITNKQKIFVSAGLGKIKLDNEIYFAISPAVPIYNALAGKTKGDIVNFNGLSITIYEVF